MIYVEKRYEIKRQALKKQDYTKRLKYRKLVARIVKQIITNNSKYLTNNDIKIISKDVYGKSDKILTRVIKRLMDKDVVKSDINRQLQDFYLAAGLDKQEAAKLLTLAKKLAVEKKDITNLLKIVDKIERAYNLVDSSKAQMSQTQIIDYSRIDAEGNPAIKEVKKIEKSINLVDNDQKQEGEASEVKNNNNVEDNEG